MVVCPFELFFLAIVLSILLRYPDSEYPLVSSNSSCIVATMTWLTSTEYLCHRWPQLCSVCLSHNPVLLSTSMTYYLMFNQSKAIRATRGAGPAYPSGTLEFIRIFVRFVLVFCVVFCRTVWVIVSFFSWQLYFLSVFHLWFLITPLISSSFSLSRNYIL